MTAYLLGHVGSVAEEDSDQCPNGGGRIDIDKADIVGTGSDREYVRASGEELQTDLGVLKVPSDVNSGELLATHLREVFRVQALRLPDLFDHFERTGAPMMPRDVGLVVGHTGASADDHVLDAGTGTGVLAAAFGRMGAEVITYEIDSEFAAVARENMELADTSSCVEVRNADLVDDLDVFDPEAFDLITLDMADAPAVVRRAPELLVPGGYCVVYAPFVEQARTAVRTARESGFRDVEAVETIQRRLRVDDRGTRPDTKGVGHTGYLTFARRG